MNIFDLIKVERSVEITFAGDRYASCKKSIGLEWGALLTNYVIGNQNKTFIHRSLKLDALCWTISVGEPSVGPCPGLPVIQAYSNLVPCSNHFSNDAFSIFTNEVVPGKQRKNGKMFVKSRDWIQRTD
ncbi:hypothetical protein VNO77_11713 [Canavalia gladiata]|uniref:Uncharacterized protein n=1 Tax=Canavalia gladiata TaxID=3824 RepID=A0AAN9MH52_CANGL